MLGFKASGEEVVGAVEFYIGVGDGGPGVDILQAIGILQRDFPLIDRFDTFVKPLSDSPPPLNKGTIGPDGSNQAVCPWTHQTAQMRLLLKKMPQQKVMHYGYGFIGYWSSQSHSYDCC